MNPKMKDIASRANVSVSTVSKIINKETKNFRKETVDRVQKIIKEMGYAPNIVARSMVTKKTGLIGLILPDISNLYFAEMAKGIEIALRHMEYNMILCNCNDSDEREKAYIDIMRQKCVDGIILIPVLSSSVDITYTTILKGIPFVILDRIFSKENTQIDSVSFDNILGGYIAVKHLTDYGHKKIGCVTGPLLNKSAHDRFIGFKNALAQASIPFQSELICQADYKYQGGYKATHKLLKNNITALVVQNDLMACGAYRAAQEMGIEIPNQLNVIGYDDTDYTQILFPTLTSVLQPNQKMGEVAAKMLVHKIQKSDYQNKIVFKPLLVVRESTCAVV